MSAWGGSFFAGRFCFLFPPVTAEVWGRVGWDRVVGAEDYVVDGLRLWLSRVAMGLGRPGDMEHPPPRSSQLFVHDEW